MSGTPTACRGFADQIPGTSGLRRPRARFLAAHYIENYIQTILDTLQPSPEAPIFIGQDPRSGNAELVERSRRVLAGNGFQRILQPDGGLVTTPAASLAIARHACEFGLMFTASHNPPEDLGLKLMLSGGGQAPPSLNRKIAERAAAGGAYRLAEPGEDEAVEVIGPYIEMLESLFDLDAIARWIDAGARFYFSAMHGAAGPFARALFGQRLGLPDNCLLDCEPRSDLGGGAPDPHLGSTRALLQRLDEIDAPAIVAACDGDGDRNFLHGPGAFVAPGDSLAVLADALHRFPGYGEGLQGAARTFPTSRAIDAVAARRGVPLHVTPSGWRHFAPLIEAGQISICGEEAFGTSSRHLQEKDGLWAITAWLSLLARTGHGVDGILREHWRQHGRHHYVRHDYEQLHGRRIEAMAEHCDRLCGQANDLPGLAGLPGEAAGRIQRFGYRDPVSGEVSQQQAWELVWGRFARVVVRPSGTTAGLHTLRVYLEWFVPPEAQASAQPGLDELARVTAEILQLRAILGRERPDLET